MLVYNRSRARKPSTGFSPTRGIVVFLLITIGATLTGLPYLRAAFTTLPGRPVAPLDDAYITYQYARQIARGLPYRYNDSDPPTTGMTSPLFGFLLAGAYRLGFTGERLVAFSIALGVLWLALSAWLTGRLASRLLPPERYGPWWPRLAALLVLASGSVQWSCFNGMETGLFIVLTLAALDAFLAPTSHPAHCALWAGLAGWTRPEGLILSGSMWFVATWMRKERGQGQALPLLAAVGVGLLPNLLNVWLTGSPSAAGLQAKSWLLNVPAYPLEIARSILHSYRKILPGLFIGWQPSIPGFVPWGLFPAAVLGWFALARRKRWPPLILTLAWFFLGTLSTATLITATWHVGRYQVPFVPLLIVCALVGLAFLWQRRTFVERQGPGLRQVPALSLLAGVATLALLGGTFYAWPWFLERYRRAVWTVAHQQLPIADWLRTNLPPGTRVGVHDVGSLRYIGQRPTYDLIGLTTAGATIPWRHGAGSVYEKMEGSPMRPDYFAIYPDVFSIPYLAATDLFAEQLFRVEVPNYAVASAGPVQGVWRADWHLAHSGERFYQSDILSRTIGLVLTDALDVADLEDEAAHHVTWWQEAHQPGFPTEVYQFPYRVPPNQEVLDGGRLLTGGIAFNVATQPGRPLWIVARLHAQQAGGARVIVNGEDVGLWRYPPVPGQWLETLFTIPARHITDRCTHIALHVETANPEFRHYAPYYFWFLQDKEKESEKSFSSPEIAQPMSALFFADRSSQLYLLGFDLSSTHYHPGDRLAITLYWQTATKTESGAKVFLHLYNTDGVLGPQSDGWAFHGTRPPYTWEPGEIVADPTSLALPADLPVGTYSLEVGLYTEETGRLPVYLDGRRQPEERVPLVQIHVSAE